MLFLKNKIKVLILIIENSSEFSDIIKESIKKSHVFFKTLSPENAIKF